MTGVIALYNGNGPGNHLLYVSSPIDFSIMVTPSIRRDMMRRNLLRDVYALRNGLTLLLSDITGDNQDSVYLTSKYAYLYNNYYARYFRNTEGTTLIIPRDMFLKLREYVLDVLAKRNPFTRVNGEAHLWTDGVSVFNAKTGAITKVPVPTACTEMRETIVHTTSADDILNQAGRMFGGLDADTYLTDILLIGRCFGYTLAVDKRRVKACSYCGRPATALVYSTQQHKFVTACNSANCRRDTFLMSLNPVEKDCLGFVGDNKSIINAVLCTLFPSNSKAVALHTRYLHLVSDDNPVHHFVYDRVEKVLYTEARLVHDVAMDLSKCPTLASANDLLEKYVAKFSTYPVLKGVDDIYTNINYRIVIRDGHVEEEGYSRQTIAN